MIGSKKLGTIRRELRSALTATGEDPVRWLEEGMTAAGDQGPGAAGEGEVLRSLRRFLKRPARKRSPKHGGGAKK